MKLNLGSLPENVGFNPLKSGWYRLKEPGPIFFTILSAPVLIIVVGLIYLLYINFINQETFQLDTTLVLWVLLIIAPIHEFIHALFTPSWGMSNKTVIGFWPQRILLYAVYTETLKKKQILLFLIMPFCILSLFPLLIMFLFKLDNQILIYFIIVNAGLSSGDIIQLPILYFQLPKNSVVRNKGWKSYWKVL